MTTMCTRLLTLPTLVRLAFALLAGAPAWAQAARQPHPLAEAESRLLADMARNGTNVARLFELGDTAHDLGADGDKQAVVRAETYLRQLLELEPNHAQGLALLGSVYTMKGRDAFWPTTQLRLVREGIEIMDRAVSLAPDDIRTRTIRALNNAHMPDFLGRAEVVRADLAWLWEKAEKDPTHFTTSARQKIALHWGRRLKRQHQTDLARKVWETGRDFAPSSPVAAEIRAELEKRH